VTIIEQGYPGFYTTARNVTLLRPEPCEDTILQSIERHYLFTANMNPLDMATGRVETTPESSSMAVMNWGPKTPWNLTSDTMEDTTAINPSPSREAKTATNSSLHPGVETTRVTALTKTWAATAMGKETQEALPTERQMVVNPKQKQPRKVLVLNLLVTWRSVIIPCRFSDWLTPAILLEDIGNSPWATPDDLLKEIFTPPNRPLGTLLLEVPLSLQGIGQGDTLTRLVRYARVYDPHDVQHFAAYQAEEAMQHFHILRRPPSGPKKPVPSMQLPHEPTLHLRFHSGQDVPPIIRAEKPKSAEDPRDGPMTPHANKSLPTNNPQEPQNEPQKKIGNTRGDMVMALSTTEGIHMEPGQLNPIPPRTWLHIFTPALKGAELAKQWSRGVRYYLVSSLNRASDNELIPQILPDPWKGHPQTGTPPPRENPSQVLVQDPRGRTHALLFHPKESVTENLERHSIQFRPLPSTDLYILWGSRIIQADLTGAENGLPRNCT